MKPIKKEITATVAIIGVVSKEELLSQRLCSESNSKGSLLYDSPLLKFNSLSPFSPPKILSDSNLL